MGAHVRRTEPRARAGLNFGALGTLFAVETGSS